MENLYQKTREILRKYNITANKNLGQNFLIEEKAVEEIIKSAAIEKEDLIIEIGPGLGTLTEELIERAGKVIAIELDPKMVAILKERFSSKENVTIIHEDVLKVPLKELIAQSGFSTTKVVANLPYYITTPIVMKLLEDKLSIDSITIMVQKEVAQRFIAKTGTREVGAITYGIEYYAESKEVVEVSRDSFLPAPEVDSMVIQLKIRKQAKVQVKDEKLLFSIIKQAFSQRRKTLINAISHQSMLSKEDAENMLRSLEIDIKVRGESLTLEQFAAITEYIARSK